MLCLILLDSFVDVGVGEEGRVTLYETTKEGERRRDKGYGARSFSKLENNDLQKKKKREELKYENSRGGQITRTTGGGGGMVGERGKKKKRNFARWPHGHNTFIFFFLKLVNSFKGKEGTPGHLKTITFFGEIKGCFST